MSLRSTFLVAVCLTSLQCTLTLNDAVKLFIKDYDAKICAGEPTCHLISDPNLPSYRRTFPYRTCMCDHECVEYNDCCQDSQFYEYAKLKISQKTYGCNPTYKVYMVTSCHPDFTDEETKNRCFGALSTTEDRDLVDYLPVINKARRIAYANEFCAICNGDKNIIPLASSIQCDLGDTGEKVSSKNAKFPSQIPSFQKGPRYSAQMTNLQKGSPNAKQPIPATNFLRGPSNAKPFAQPSNFQKEPSNAIPQTPSRSSHQHGSPNAVPASARTRTGQSGPSSGRAVTPQTRSFQDSDETEPPVTTKTTTVGGLGFDDCNCGGLSGGLSTKAPVTRVPDYIRSFASPPNNEVDPVLTGAYYDSNVKEVASVNTLNIHIQLSLGGWPRKKRGDNSTHQDSNVDDQGTGRAKRQSDDNTDAVANQVKYDHSLGRYVARIGSQIMECDMEAKMPKWAETYVRKCVPNVVSQCANPYESDVCQSYMDIRYDVDNKLIYRNDDCARCNGADSGVLTSCAPGTRQTIFNSDKTGNPTEYKDAKDKELASKGGAFGAL